VGSFLETAVHHLCPHCAAGALFERRYALKDHCEACGLDLVGRHGAHYGGAIILGYGIGALAALACFAGLYWWFGFFPRMGWIVGVVAVLSIVLTFRSCKAVYTWLLYRTGELPPPE